MNFNSRNHRIQGFTLLELLLAIVVAGILASIAVPSFSGFLARQQLRSDVIEVVSMLSFARSEAIKRREEVTAEISQNSLWRIEVSTDDVLRIAIGRQAAVSLSGTSSVSFDFLGAAQSCPCQIELIHSRLGKEDKKVIRITPAGGVRSD
ncbi:GspH/FimT family pseudopilin [Halomonas sp. BLK-85]